MFHSQLISLCGNQTSLTEFILLGFGTVSKLQILLFLLFLVIYIVTMAGNILIVVLVVTDQQLHTLMYFFLGNLSCLETCYTSTVLPRIMASLLTGDRTISIGSCIAQFYFAGFFAATECYLLAVMSYDRYLAICKPLQYATLMNGSFCLQLAAGSWINGFLALIQTATIFMLPFHGPNKINHFFCDVLPVLRLVSTDTSLINAIISFLTRVFTIVPLILIITSYASIIRTILKMHSGEGRHKAFSACSSHLITVILFYCSAFITYLRPSSNVSVDTDRALALLYTIIIPTFNPIIYSLRNKEVKEALRKFLTRSNISLFL
uniref:Olfactory receptor n=1 Tax=Gopherus evgoodei TaxID=1825980 RepID=A0A8C4XYC4_9SAUR